MRALGKLSIKDKEKLKKSLYQLNNLLVTGILPKGLGLKKLTDDLYELRVDIRLRVILKMGKDTVFLALAGSHNDIKQYLKKFK